MSHSESIRTTVVSLAVPLDGGGVARASSERRPIQELIGESAVMRDVRNVVRRASNVDASVLITGESGTGKEVVARTLHRQGARSHKPFIAVNCTAIPEGLLESELFGHVRGAFTGATSARRGLFDRANGGTLFLDEIGDMGSELQAKLLRALQEREIRPVGATQTVKVDVRIIAATHRDLDVEMQSGRFREDLYYRLNVIPIQLPPLRERPEDIPALVEVFTRRHDAGRGRRFSDDALRSLQGFSWRGNARELENFVERTLALTDSQVIDVAELHVTGQLEVSTDGDALTLGLAEAARSRLPLREIEERYILQMLEETRGRKGEAAKRLGIDRKTLYRRGTGSD